MFPLRSNLRRVSHDSYSIETGFRRRVFFFFAANSSNSCAARDYSATRDSLRRPQSRDHSTRSDERDETQHRSQDHARTRVCTLTIRNRSARRELIHERFNACTRDIYAGQRVNTAFFVSSRRAINTLLRGTAISWLQPRAERYTRPSRNAARAAAIRRSNGAAASCRELCGAASVRTKGDEYHRCKPHSETTDDD